MHNTEAAWGPNWVFSGKDGQNSGIKRPPSAEKGKALCTGSRRPLTVFYESGNKCLLPFGPTTVLSGFAHEPDSFSDGFAECELFRNMFLAIATVFAHSLSSPLDRERYSRDGISPAQHYLPRA